MNDFGFKENLGYGYGSSFMQPRSVVDSLPRDPSGRWSLSKVFDNFATGVRQGMMLDNLFLEDPEIANPQGDMPVVRMLGVLGGAIGEGVVTQSWMLRGLQVLSKSSKVPKVAQAAKKALDNYLIGEDIDFVRKIAGHAMLGVAGEAALNVAGGIETKDAARNVAFAAVGGVAGGAIEGAFKVRKAAKAGFLPERETGEGAFKWLREKAASIREGVNENLRFEHALRKYSGFDPSLSVEDWNLSHEMSAFLNKESRIARRTEEALRTGIARPLQKSQDPDSFKKFYELVSLSKEEALARTGKKAGNLDELAEKRRLLEASAPQEVRDAFFAHKKAVVEVAERVRKHVRFEASPIARQLDLKKGAADAQTDLFHEYSWAAKQLEAEGAAAEVVDYTKRMAQQAGEAAEAVIDDLYAEALTDVEQFLVSSVGHKIQFLRRGTFIERSREILEDTSDNYYARMAQAMTLSQREELMDEFVQNLKATHAVKLGDIPFELQKKLEAGEIVTLPDGRRVKQFNLRPGHIYPDWAVSDAGAAMLNKIAYESAADPTMVVRGKTLPEAKPMWRIDPGEAVVMPAEIGDRITEKFYQQNPFKVDTPGFKQLQAATAAWKINTLWWGLTRFAGTQLIGDGINLFRSNPQALKKVPEAIRVIAAKYRTPLKTEAQIQSTLIGAGVGAGASLLDGDTDGMIGGALLGAGVGYAYKTRALAGTLDEANPVLAERIALYDQADELGVINAGQFVSDADLAGKILESNVGKRIGQKAPTEGRQLFDTFLTMLSGRIHGDPKDWAYKWVQGVELMQNERENIMRLAGYIQLLEEGVAPKVAQAKTAAALVDYTRFSDFENKFLRGFLLPFYSFTRHNTMNWLRTLGGVTHLAKGTRVEGIVPQLGGDVGGKPVAALIATSVLAGYEVAAQAWNQTFFPDVENNLESWQRERFHVIMGNPLTGEAFKDVRGRAMVFTTELGYEATLEMLGLARPGKVLNLFGADIPDSQGILERAFAIEEYEGAPKPVREAVSAFSDQVLQLMTPFLKGPLEVMSNSSWKFSAPIVPEAYRGTPEQWDFQLRHLAHQFFRQTREAQTIAGDVSRGGWDPLTSAFGVGLPVRGVDMDASIRRNLHEKLEAAQLAERRSKAPWQKAIDDIIYSRPRWDKPKEDEYDKLQAVLAEKVPSPELYEEAVRYYMERASKSSVLRHWNTLRVAERMRFAQALEPGDLEAFVFYANGGESIQKYLEPSKDDLAAFMP